MAALTSEQRARHAELLRALFATVESVDEVIAGYVFKIPLRPGLLQAATEFVSLERLCCPFFDFRIDLPAEATSFQLGITGREGIKPFIRAEFGSELPAAIGFGG